MDEKLQFSLILSTLAGAGTSLGFFFPSPSLSPSPPLPPSSSSSSSPSLFLFLFLFFPLDDFRKREKPNSSLDLAAYDRWDIGIVSFKPK